MTDYKNELDQAIGFPLPNWQPCKPPPKTAMTGRYCRIEPIDPGKHGGQLHKANQTDKQRRIWTYLTCGPFASEADYCHWLETYCLSDDPLFHAVVDMHTGEAVGIASYMRIKPEHGVIEVGHINYSPLLQQTTAATEAMYLMMRRVFDELKYRRYEWKCDALNVASCNAARRLGFQYEGTFRQALIYKHRNRDTAWFAVIDKDWPHIKAAFERWLAPENFAGGQQRNRLDVGSASRV